MKHSFYFRSSMSVLSLLIGTVTLAGCGGASSFSNPGSAENTPAPPAPLVVDGPPVSGTSYGGHAPIEGQHVYLLQPGTTGYGSLATSLLGTGTTTSPNGFTLTANTSDPNVPPGAMYETTDSNGNFYFTGAYKCTVGQPVYIYAYGGKISATALNNKNIVQLATLGNCPSSGNFSTVGNGALSFVYLNEVSTVATAYTFQPFTLVNHNDAWHIGTGNTTQGLLGIANAANTAAQLYDIQGGTQLSTSFDGEGHVANYQTLLAGTPNQGNGIVPQATIDTLANIIANCVDSTVAVVGTPTSQCSSLFKVATDNGENGGTQPTDTATAVINIARFPAGNHSAGTANVDATYVTDLFALQTGTVPYVPDLNNAPHDWTLAIDYPVTAVTGYPLATNSTLGLAESIAIDDIGQVWVTAQDDFWINRFSNLGVRNSADQLTYIPGYVSIDGGNNAWTGNANSSSPIYEAGSNGVFTTSYGSGYNSAYTVIANQAGDAFFFALTTTGSNGAGGTSGTTPDYGMFEYGPTGTLSGPFDCCGTTTTTTTPTAGTLTITSATVTAAFHGGVTTYTYTFQAGNTGGNPLVPGPVTLVGLTNKPNNPNAGANWASLDGVQTAATVSGTQFTVTGTTNLHIAGSATGSATYSNNVTTTTTTTGPIPSGDNVGHGAIDSAGDLWITSETGNTIARVSPTGTSEFTPITTIKQPEFPAIDGSGNAWIPIQAATGPIYVVSPTGTTTQLTSGTGTGAIGANLSYPFGAAVDGNGNIWITNRCGAYNVCTTGNTAYSSTLVELNGTGTNTPGTIYTAISPATNYIPEAQYPATATTFTKIMADPLNLAIDSSGNIWITNYTGTAANSSVTEIIGAAGPVATPLSVAAGTSSLGAKP